MLCHLDTVLLVHPLSLRPRLLLVCRLLARLMLLLMVHHLMLRLRTMLLMSLLNNLTLLLHLMTLLLHHMAVLMHFYVLLLRSPRWHKVTIFMVLLRKLLLLRRNLVVRRPVPPSCSRGLCRTSWCNVLLLNWSPSWPNFE